MKANNTESAPVRWLTFFLDIIRWPAAIALFMLAVLTTADVIGRKILLSPITGNNEFQMMMMVIIIFLAMGYTTIKNRHANADIVVSHLSRRNQAIASSITWFLSAAIFGLISFQATKWGLGEVAAPTRVTTLMLINESPYIMVAAFGCITICIASLVNFFRALGQLRVNQVEVSKESQ